MEAVTAVGSVVAVGDGSDGAADAGFIKMGGTPRLAVERAVRRRNCLRLVLAFIVAGFLLTFKFTQR